MASDLLKELSGTEDFQQSLELIRGDRQDYETFFEDVFKQLEAALTETAEEQLTWEQQRSQKETELVEQSAALERQSRELETQREEFLAEALTAAQLNSQSDPSTVGELESCLKETLEEAARERQSLQDVLASTGSQAERLTSLAEALDAAQQQFQQQIEQRNEISSDGQSQAASEEVLARLQQLEQERSDMLQGRAMLEAELESVRQRAVDQMTALEQQKRLASEQQNQWSDELRRQRQLLEQVLQRLVELEMLPANPAAALVSAAGAGKADEATDSVLSSVMAQFDVLQKDVARRRKKSAK